MIMSTKDKKTLLLVDADENFRAEEKAHFAGAGFEILEAPTRKEAEAILAEKRPDLCVTEVTLEEPDGGFALCYHVKKKDPKIPIVIVTSVTADSGIDFDVTTREEKSWIKADAFLAKPVRFEQLEREIERLL